jgi:hypothetical protein
MANRVCNTNMAHETDLILGPVDCDGDSHTVCEACEPLYIEYWTKQLENRN